MKRIPAPFSLTKGVKVRLSIPRNSDIFEVIFNHSTDGIVIFDLEATILNVNPAFERMTGWSKEELIGKRHPLTPLGELENVMKSFRAVASGVVPFSQYQGKKFGRMVHFAILPQH